LIGPRDGLNKYDGTKFISFRHNSDNPESLSNSWVTDIFEDDQNNFTVYRQNSISDNEIWDIEQQNKNTLFISTNNGLTKVNLFDKSFSFIYKKEESRNTLKGNKTRCLYSSKDGL